MRKLFLSAPLAGLLFLAASAPAQAGPSVKPAFRLSESFCEFLQDHTGSKLARLYDRYCGKR